MSRLAIIACVIVCLAVAAGCGSKSSTSAVSTIKPIYGNLSTFGTFSGSLIGGAVQKGPFAFKLNNYSTVTDPTFRHVSSSAFSGPIGLTTDGVNHYVANYLSHKIVKIDPGGVVTVFAGSGIESGFGNISTVVSARSATFKRLTAITTDGTVFYAADSGNHAIRKIDADGMVSVLAGSGSVGSVDTDTSLGVVAKFYNPTGVTVVGKHVFVADTNNHTIRMIDTDTHMVTTVAGRPGLPGSADGNRKTARFNQPARITTDGRNLYVTDFGNRTVRRISLTTEQVDTIAGHAGIVGTIDGPKGSSRFTQPNGITTDGINLYVTDSSEGTVRKIELISGDFHTTTIRRGLNTPIGITTNGSGLYIADRNAHSIVRIK